MIKCARAFPTPRLPDRRVDEISFLRWVAQRGREQGDWVFDVTHGGDCWSRQGMAECLFAMSDPFGNVLWWGSRIPASDLIQSTNHRLYRIANHCLPGSGFLVGTRGLNEELQRQSVRKVLESMHSQHFTEMEVIASAASA